MLRGSFRLFSPRSSRKVSTFTQVSNSLAAIQDQRTTMNSSRCHDADMQRFLHVPLCCSTLLSGSCVPHWTVGEVGGGAGRLRSRYWLMDAGVSPRKQPSWNHSTFWTPDTVCVCLIVEKILTHRTLAREKLKPPPPPTPPGSPRALSPSPPPALDVHLVSRGQRCVSWVEVISSPPT